MIANPQENITKFEQIDPNLINMISIAIKSYKERNINSKPVTFYDIEIRSNITQNVWTVSKRYNEFKALHASLSKAYVDLPPMPSTTMFKVTSKEGINKRKAELEKFLKECVQRRDIFLNKNFRNFLELEANAPEIAGNDVKLKYDYKKLPLGVRDFIVVPHKEIMLMCCSDMNAVSRADSMLSNFYFPWEEKDKSNYVPLGAAFIYQCKPDEKEIYKIHKCWAKSFPIQTGAICWDDISEIYCVGNDDGKIHIFRAVPNTYYMKMKDIVTLSFHTNRVMGIAIDPETLTLYSCSTDKNFCSIDLRNKEPKNMLIKSSTFGYTNLILDDKSHRIFLTNEEGELSIYTTTTYPPTHLKSLYTSGKSCIRAAYLQPGKNLFFAANVLGKICTINLGEPGKESSINEMSSFSIGKIKIRVCVHNHKSDELITGDQNGRVIIWNLKNGKPIYLWLAHPMSPITKMWLQPEHNLLWTGGKDKHLCIWQLPPKWVSNDKETFDEQEVSTITEKMTKYEFKKRYFVPGEELTSDDDDLNGWNFREY